ncbi:MAG: helix-turn-helix transcriptional regulator [Oscillospiraceae bacterium]|nr:helix-turn-helix transcriptional regulator [Oscillospiraceae bacterium]
MTKDELGRFIAENRKSLGMTQEELANKLFVTNKAVSKWEKGQSFPDISMFEPLAEALGVSVAELIACEKEVKAETTIKSLAAEIFRKEKTKRIMAFLICVLSVFLICAVPYVVEYIDIKNYDYVYLNGFYYGFNIDGQGRKVDEKFIGEYIGEVIATGVVRNPNNKNGDSNKYPVGAKVYDVRADDKEYIKLYDGKISVGEAVIEIDGIYYLGAIAHQNNRDSDLYRHFYTEVYGVDYNTYVEVNPK